MMPCPEGQTRIQRDDDGLGDGLGIIRILSVRTDPETPTEAGRLEGVEPDPLPDLILDPFDKRRAGRPGARLASQLLE
jgi:hypothetical protein